MTADGKAAASPVDGHTRNQATSGFFGLQYRRKFKRTQQIADAYNQNLVLCLQGASVEGVGLKMKADAAARAYASDQKGALDQEALYQKQRTDAQNALNAAVASVDSLTKIVIDQNNQKIANADQDYQQNLMMDYQRQALAHQNTQNLQSSNLANLQNTDRRLQSAVRDETLANNQLACSTANGGNLTQSQADAIPTSTSNIAKAKKALNDAAGYCDQMENICTDPAMISKANSACKQARHAINPSAAGDNGQDAADSRTLSSPISRAAKSAR